MSFIAEMQRLLLLDFPASETDVTCGTCRFAHGENQDLLLRLLGKVNRNCPDILSFTAFQNCFNAALQGTKPSKPNRDDPRYENATRRAMYSRAKYHVYKEYCYQKDVKTYHQKLQAHETKQEYSRSIIQTYRNTPRGYSQCVFDALPDTEKAFFLQQHTFRINEKARQRHSYITGQSGSGKTELLKTLIHHYLTQNTNTALILLDPHGDIAEQVAQFKENADNERLVYIDPFLSDDHTPVLNPFHLPANRPSERVIDRMTEELYSVFREVLKSSFTAQMETILRPCIITLLLMGNKDINDLQRFMDDDRNAHYVDFAIKNLYNPSQVDFLKTDFYKDAYNPTKQAIKTKLQSLLNSNTFRQLLTGKPTIDLTALTEQKKLIIFNLSAGKLGGDTSDVIGRFLLVQIKSLAFQRAEMPEHTRTPTHLFIDECQRYLSPSIKLFLTESRKYKLFLTLANQYYGQDMSTGLKDAISNNTAVKIAGKNGDKNATTHHKETGADIEELKTLGVGEFHIKEDVKPSVKVKAPSSLVGNQNAMSTKQWEAKKQQLVNAYYQRLNRIDPDEFKPSTPVKKNTAINSNEPAKTTPKSTKIKPKYGIDL